MGSLRRRAVLGGSAWALLIVAIGAIVLYSYLNALTENRFDRALADRHLQIVIALSNSGGDPETMYELINDPAYERPYSGRYWQATGPDGQVIASRSLFDTLLEEPSEGPADVEFWVGAGPDGSVRGVRRSITLESGETWIVDTAESLNSLRQEQRDIRKNLLLIFALVGLLGIAGAMLQTLVVVRPLEKLRQDVAHRWDMETSIDPANYPSEVSPLVSDINTLLDRNREIVARGRRQAADMAHALKTPSAILRNELEALARQNVDVAQALDAMTRIDGQLKRSLARIRAANSHGSAQLQTDVSHSIERLASLFQRMPEFNAKQLDLRIPPELSVPVDRQDIEEILGNLLENAFRWSKSRLLVTGSKDDDLVIIRVEDDGPGIPEADRREALRSGGRLDSSVPGSGLGLAIAGDLLQAYGGNLQLLTSPELGGLCVEITISGTSGLTSAAATKLRAARKPA
jgi:signal transduction histidine kinase